MSAPTSENIQRAAQVAANSIDGAEYFDKSYQKMTKREKIENFFGQLISKLVQDVKSMLGIKPDAWSGNLGPNSPSEQFKASLPTEITKVDSKPKTPEQEKALTDKGPEEPKGEITQKI